MESRSLYEAFVSAHLSADDWTGPRFYRLAAVQMLQQRGEASMRSFDGHAPDLTRRCLLARCCDAVTARALARQAQIEHAQIDLWKCTI